MTRSRWRATAAGTLLLVLVVTVGYTRHSRLGAERDTPASSSGSPRVTGPADSGFDRRSRSLTDPNSPWVIVNKQHPLRPRDFEPGDLRTPHVSLRDPGTAEMELRREPASAIERLFAAALNDGVKLQISTAYRSLAYQTVLYDNAVAEKGQAHADRFNARPGYSEHQTGWAVDLRDVRPLSEKCGLETCFGDLPEGKWVAANAYRFGFILRYPADKEAVTGYSYEPWHLRYVGLPLAEEMHRRRITTLEEFFGVAGGTVYRPAS